MQRIHYIIILFIAFALSVPLPFTDFMVSAGFAPLIYLFFVGFVYFVMFLTSMPWLSAIAILLPVAVAIGLWKLSAKITDAYVMAKLNLRLARTACVAIGVFLVGFLPIYGIGHSGDLTNLPAFWFKAFQDLFG